jgi:hypothetical protein
MTMMSERIGLLLSPVPPIDDEEAELETNDSFIPPLHSHPFMHPHLRSPPPPPSTSTTAPVVT